MTTANINIDPAVGHADELRLTAAWLEDVAQAVERIPTRRGPGGRGAEHVRQTLAAKIRGRAALILFTANQERQSMMPISDELRSAIDEALADGVSRETIRASIAVGIKLGAGRDKVDVDALLVGVDAYLGLRRDDSPLVKI